MHTSGTGPVTFFWGTILAWGGTLLAWRGISSDLGRHGPKIPPWCRACAVRQLYDELVENFDQKKTTCVIFINLKKTFNTVNHSIFLQKLEQYGIRGLPLQLLTSYYSDRTQYTIVNNHKSKASPVPCGVPQGSTLDLSLFTVYVNDLPQCSGFKTKLFVDDTVLTISNNREAKQSFGVNREIREITKLNLVH